MSKAYIILAKWNYGIDFWFGGLSDDIDDLTDFWTLYLENWIGDNKPTLIKIVELSCDSDLVVTASDVK